MQDKLHYMRRSVSCDERSVECGVSGSERMKLFVGKVFENLELRG